MESKDPKKKRLRVIKKLFKQRAKISFEFVAFVTSYIFHLFSLHSKARKRERERESGQREKLRVEEEEDEQEEKQEMPLTTTV